MSWTKEDDVPFEPPKGPSPLKARAGWASVGDVDALWGLLSRSDWDAIDQEDVLKLLTRALEVQSRADPERFAADVFGRMVVFMTAILLRSHVHLANYVEHSGRAVRLRAQPPGDLPKVAIDTLIPRVVELQEHLASLLLSQSSVARQWALVRKNKAKVDQAKGARTEPVRGKKPSVKGTDVGPEARDNGKVDHRLAALLDGRGSGTNGTHHDD